MIFINEACKFANKSIPNLYCHGITETIIIAKVEAKIGNRIIQEAQKLSKKLSGGTGTPAKDALQKRMERLTKDFSEKFPNGEISVKELQTLKTDLNDIIN